MAPIPLLDRVRGRRGELPLPPLGMRSLVGPTEPAAFDNPTGKLIWEEYESAQYRSFFDFGCGCGRIARQLIQQRATPDRYLGIDLHNGMVRWCRRNLKPRAAGFEFVHHDVHNPGLNPGEEKPLTAAFPAESRAFTFVNAWSVFTHLVQPQVDHYLSEVARVLAPGGVFQSTWFLFDERAFPMMQDFQHALYADAEDPTGAAMFDRRWVQERIREAGLSIYDATPPVVRGFQWILRMRHAGEAPEIELPADEAPAGEAPLLRSTQS